MSIFTKLCPQCTDSVEASSARCHCGYIFDTTTDGSVCAGDLLEQNERMYLEYLEARVLQADQEFAVAQNAAARDPENRLAAAELLRAEQAMNNARAELSSQSLRLETTRALVTRNRPAATPTTKSIRAVPAPPKPAPARPTAPVAKVAEPAKPVVTKSRPVPMRMTKPAKPRPLPGLKLAVPLNAKPSTPKPVRQVDSQPKPAAAIDSSQSFRNAQAVKAARVMRGNTEKPRPVPVPPKATPAKPRTVDPLASAKAALQPRSSPDMRECPNCTAQLKLDVVQCRCGYEFPTAGAEIPALSLPTSEAVTLSEHLTLAPLNRSR